tara:strand:- start:2616 stop:2786 length:171 start_codon:yes stop_codon:yes gene_type:complete
MEKSKMMNIQVEIMNILRFLETATLIDKQQGNEDNLALNSAKNQLLAMFLTRGMKR